jgi:3-dehydroquinate dehydratase I
MSKIKIGPISLGALPRIIAVLDRHLTSQELARLYQEGARLAEIRFDLLPGPFEKDLAFAETVRNAAPFGLLGTLRETPKNLLDRLEMFTRIIPLIDGVDIEIDSPIRDSVIRNAHGKTLIVSHHDFEKMPGDIALTTLAKTALKAGADIVKIAGLAQSAQDAARLLDFAAKADFPIIAIAMGEAGMNARVEALKRGSLATYAFTGDAPVAPGQRGVRKIAEILKKSFPGFPGP